MYTAFLCIFTQKEADSRKSRLLANHFGQKSHATGWFWQACNFASAFCWARWEQVVDFFQGITGFLGHLTNHRRNAVLSKVVLQVVDELPMILC